MLSAISGRIRRRLALAIVLTALIPLLAAIAFATSAINRASARFYNPEFGTRLDESLGLYQELARAVKTGMRHAASAIAADQRLRNAVRQRDRSAIDRELHRPFSKYPSLVSLRVEEGEGGKVLGERTRGKKIDPEKEHTLTVTRPLTDSADIEEDEPQLVATFTAEKAGGICSIVPMKAGRASSTSATLGRLSDRAMTSPSPSSVVVAAPQRTVNR